MNRAVGPARGVLRDGVGAGTFHHARHAVADDLADRVAHVWIVRWSVPAAAPVVRQTLPHPNVHLVFEGRQARVHGVHAARFSRTLAGEGGVVGIKVRSGAFAAALGAPVSRLRGRTVDLVALWPDADAIAASLQAHHGDDAAQVACLEPLLRARLPPLSGDAALAAMLVEAIEADPTLLRMDQLAAHVGLSARALQRLFATHVGVGPKWVINRYRLHEALERVHAGAVPDWAELAFALGYHDQAHFVRDFSRLVGVSPGRYAARVGAQG